MLTSKRKILEEFTKQMRIRHKTDVVMSSISTTDVVSFNEGETSVFGSEGNGNSRRRDAQGAIFRSGCIKDQRNSTMSREISNRPSNEARSALRSLRDHLLTENQYIIRHGDAQRVFLQHIASEENLQNIHLDQAQHDGDRNREEIICCRAGIYGRLVRLAERLVFKVQLQILVTTSVPDL